MVRIAAQAERAYFMLVREIVGDNEADALLVRSPVRTVGGVTVEALDMHPYVRIWMTERKELARVAKMALDAGVDAKRLELEEALADALMLAIRQGIADAGLPQEQAERVRESIGMRLAVLDRSA